MNVGDLCRHNTRHDWGIAVVKEIHGANAILLFEKAGRIKLAPQGCVTPVARSTVPAGSPLLDRSRWHELDLPHSEKQARKMEADDLVLAVQNAVKDSGCAIAWASPHVRDWLKKKYLRTGERREDRDASRNGPHFEAADQEACRAGRLQKWKQQNGNVGWSLPTDKTRAQSAAVDEGLLRVDRDDKTWRYHEWDAEGERWVLRGTRARD